jgi:hypothetical protein
MSRTNKSPKKIIVITTIGFLVIISIVTAWKIRNDSKIMDSPIYENIPQNDGPDSISGENNDAAPQNIENKSDKAAASDQYVATSGDPTKPYGTFVSNHRPSLSGSNGVPSELVSICSGTPGATCTISFIKDGQSKSLDQKIIDSTGSATWYWDIKNAGLSVGNWSIKATSSIGTKTVEATDSLPLEVQL